MLEHWTARRSKGTAAAWRTGLIVAISAAAGFAGGRASAGIDVPELLSGHGASVAETPPAPSGQTPTPPVPKSHDSTIAASQAGASVRPSSKIKTIPIQSTRPSCNAGLQIFRDLVVPANLRELLDVKIDVVTSGTRGEWRICDASVSITGMGMPAEVHTYGVRWFDDQHTRVEVQRFR